MIKDNPRKRLTDYIDIERDILPNNVTAIYAGTNAGKTTLIEGYHGKKADFIGLAEKYKVLLITSRKQKVIQTDFHQESFLKDLRDVGAVVHWDEYSKNVVCTNAHIHSYLSNHYCKGNELTYFWREFDFVVVDEVHSICTDSPFADCSYSVKSLIEKIAEEQKELNLKTKILLMTATPQPIEWFVDKLKAKVLDYRQTIKSIKPKYIKVSHKAKINDGIMNTVNRGGTVVYYFSHLKGLLPFIKETIANGILEEQIAFAVSDKKALKQLREVYPTIYENSIQLEQSVSEHEVLDPQFKLILTNGKWREGININNTIETLAIESHYIIDIQQIIGRFRKGVREVCLVSDAWQFAMHDSFHKEFDYYKNRIPYDNEQLRKRTFVSIDSQKHEPILLNSVTNKFIKSLLTHSKYIAFNIIKECFEPNLPYLQYAIHFQKSMTAIKEAIDSHTQLDKIDEYFADIECLYHSTENPLLHIEWLFERAHCEFNKTELSRERFQKLIDLLRENLINIPEASKCNFTKFKRVLNIYGCDYRIVGKTSNCRYIIYKMDNYYESHWGKLREKSNSKIIQEREYF